MIPNQSAHVEHARRRRVSFLGIDSRKKKARDFAKKRHEREQNFSLFSLARVCHRVLSRRRSRIIRSSIVVYYYSVVVSRKRGTLRSSFLSEKEGERGAQRRIGFEILSAVHNELFLLNHHVPGVAEGKRVAVFTKLGVFLPTERQ